MCTAGVLASILFWRESWRLGSWSRWQLNIILAGNCQATNNLLEAKERVVETIAIEEQNIKYQFNREHVSKIMDFDILNKR